MFYRQFFLFFLEWKTNNFFKKYRNELKFSQVGFITSLDQSCKVWKHLQTLYQCCAWALNKQI